MNNKEYFIDYDNEKTLDKLVELFSDINTLYLFHEYNGNRYVLKI